MGKRKDLSILQTINGLSDEELARVRFRQGDTIVDRYEIVELLGVGGMGAVYQVKDLKLGNDLKALKMMLDKLICDERSRQRFRNEILISQKLTHPNILRVYDYGEINTMMFLTMEYVAGPNMREWLEEKQQQGPVSLQEIAELVAEILDGLEVAHRYTVHRDIKPENVLLPEGAEVRVKICDFGLAQLQSRGVQMSSSQVLGTYNYMAPEQQIAAVNADRRSDLYSLGVVCYECLTGRFPVGRFKLPSELRLDLPKGIDEFIERALQSEPKDRFQQAGEMKQALLAIVGEVPTKAAVSQPAPSRRPEGEAERALMELREKLPPHCLDEFVAKHHGAWGYEDYRELMARIGREIGEFDEAQLSELVEEARRHYRKQTQAGSTQQSRIEQKFAANLRRVEASGLIGQFVQNCGGNCQDGEWQELLQRLESDGFYPLDEERLREAVQQESERYHQAGERAAQHKRTVAALEKGRQYQDGLDYLAEVRGEGYWDQELQECYDRLNQRCNDYAAALAAGRQALAEKQWDKAVKDLHRADELIAGKREVEELLTTAENQLAEQRRRYRELSQEAERCQRSQSYQQALDIWRQAEVLGDDDRAGTGVKRCQELLASWEQTEQQLERLRNQQQLAASDMQTAERLVEASRSDFGRTEQWQQWQKWQQRAGEEQEQRYSQAVKAAEKQAEAGEFIAAVKRLDEVASIARQADAHRKLRANYLDKRRQQQALHNQIAQAQQHHRYDDIIESCRRLLAIDPHHRQASEWQEQAGKEQQQLQKLFKEAQKHAEVGEFTAAAARLDEVAGIAPAEIIKLRADYLDKHERQQKLLNQIAQAQQHKQYSKVIASCGKLLAIAPGHSQAKEWQEQAVKEQERERQALSQQRKQLEEWLQQGRFMETIAAIDNQKAAWQKRMQDIREQAQQGQEALAELEQWQAKVPSKGDPVQAEQEISQALTICHRLSELAPHSAEIKERHQHWQQQQARCREIIARKERRRQVQVLALALVALIAMVIIGLEYRKYEAKRRYERAYRAGEQAERQGNWGQALAEYRWALAMKFVDTGAELAGKVQQMERRKWEEEEPKRREAGFSYLRTQTYSCGGQTHTVKEYRHEKTGLEFVLLPGGNFNMGSSDGESDEKPVRRVRVDGFLLSKTEVTQGVWEKIMGNNPCKSNKGANRPVHNVSWEECKQFCERAGLSLPTEAEWEYACRAGTETKYYWGNEMDGRYVWYKSNSSNETHPVGEKQPNAFGLYDMSGNVWEWCRDWYASDYYSKGENDNPPGSSTGSGRVFRGGGCSSVATNCRGARRFYSSPGFRYDDLGLRVAAQCR